PIREVRERPKPAHRRRGQPGQERAASLDPLVDRLEGKGRGEQDADVPREGGQRSGHSGQRPAPVPRAPERRDGEQEEQGLAVGGEEEERGGEDREEEHRRPGDGLGALGRGEQVEDAQSPGERGVRDDQRGGERVAADHGRDRSRDERVQGEEGCAPVGRAVALRGDPEEPEAVEALPGGEQVLPPRVGHRLSRPAGDRDRAKRRDERDEGHAREPQDEQPDPNGDEDLQGVEEAGARLWLHERASTGIGARVWAPGSGSGRRTHAARQTSRTAKRTTTASSKAPIGSPPMFEYRPNHEKRVRNTATSAASNSANRRRS